LKQITQNLRSGQLKIDEVPAPLLKEQGILVRNRASLVSAGTERMMMELAKKSLVGKARERPDLVRKVLEKLRRDGFLATLQTVREKLDREAPMGYSACGEVVAVGARAREFQPGQLVACAGAGHANHAEVNYIPRLLATRVPEGVSAEAAAYTTVGTIALQGVRNADVRFGETAVVLGLGLIGQLTVQILKASGCRVVGLDLSPQRVELAAQHGADLALVPGGEQTTSEVMSFTRGRGADAVLITAATESNAPVEQAAELARDRARVVMVGVTGMDLPRRDYFQKELTFIVSRSYGPGRYDNDYEEAGHDYPVGHVRWTENRNMEAFLDLVAGGGVRPEVLTTHRFPIERATDAMQLILEGSEPHLGVVLTYPEPSTDGAAQPSRIELPTNVGKGKGQVGVSFIGAGGFSRATHLPNLRGVSKGAARGVCDADGLAARAAADKFGFSFCTSQPDKVLSDDQTDLVILTTPHSKHSEAICKIVAAGKVAFVEKPLAISMEQLQDVVAAVDEHQGQVMVGFNRRFSPLALELKQFLAGRGPLMMQYRCNAGPLPPDHWISDPAEGGRIIGEACHFFDLFGFLTDAPPVQVTAAAPGTGSVDDALVTVTYEDGSVGTLAYTSQGSSAAGKERLEVFAGGSTAVLEEYRQMWLYPRGGKSTRRKLMQPDKGHAAELAAVVNAVAAGERLPISFQSLVDTTLVSFAAVDAMGHGQPVVIDRMRPGIADSARG